MTTAHDKLFLIKITITIGLLPLSLLSFHIRKKSLLKVAHKCESTKQLRTLFV